MKKVWKMGMRKCGQDERRAPGEILVKKIRIIHDDGIHRTGKTVIL